MSVRKTAALNGLGRQTKPENHVSTCKVCGCGIYKGQAYSWRSKPMGLSHDECGEER